MRQLCSTYGNAEYWQDNWLPDFRGVGEYLDADGYLVIVKKGGREVMPKKYHDVPIGQIPPHWTAFRYGFGQMYFGDWYEAGDIVGMKRSPMPSPPPFSGRHETLARPEEKGDESLSNN